MILEEITALEDKWMPEKYSMPHVFSHERPNRRQLEVYEAWSMIFELYVIEARDGNTEALKRALFLYWYSYSEPYELTGLYMLDKELSLDVLGKVNGIVKKNILDIEFKWMISYYYSIADFYIDQFKGFDELKKISRITDSLLWREYICKSCFTSRGQMGHYWESILES